MNPSSRVVVLMASFVAALAACSGGGGGGGGGPQIPASVPAGSGAVTIQMVGTWQVSSVTVIESNTTLVVPPGDGTQFVIGPTSLLSIGGLSVAQADLETLLGVALEAYVNQLDGRTLLYGVIADQRATGGRRDQAAVAAGSINDNTIAVEGFISTQDVNDTEPQFVRWRGFLTRVSPAIFVPEPVRPDADGDEAAPRPTLRDVFGGR